MFKRPFPPKFRLMIIVSSVLLSLFILALLPGSAPIAAGRTHRIGVAGVNAQPAELPPDFTLSTNPTWQAVEGGVSLTLAWGDVDNDGDLDLVAGRRANNNTGLANHLYLNQNGRLSKFAVWSSPPDNTNIVAWADLTGDGYLDLVVGNDKQDKVYINDNGTLPAMPSWISADSDNSTSLAVGDVDGDGWYDLITGNRDGEDQFYRHQGDTNIDQANAQAQLFADPLPIAGTMSATYDLALADANQDGWLDLAAGREEGLTLFLNDGLGGFDQQATCAGVHPYVLAWGDAGGNDLPDLALVDGNLPSGVYVITDPDESLESCTLSAWRIGDSFFNHTILQWADVNGDGRLDISTGTSLNLQTDQFESSMTLIGVKSTTGADGQKQATLEDLREYSEFILPQSQAWGDVDGDGDLDIVTAGPTGQIRLYTNETGHYAARPGYTLPMATTDDIERAWGDFDNDGDYDLLTLRFDEHPLIQPNEQGNLASISNWETFGFGDARFFDTHDSRSVALGDVNGDSYIDVAIGLSGAANAVFLNQNGTFGERSTPIWNSPDEANTRDVAWGDVDGDGDLDLAVGNAPDESGSGADQLFLNHADALTATTIVSLTLAWQAEDDTTTEALRWMDVDGDGDLDLVSRNAFFAENNTLSRIYFNDQGRLSSEAFVTRNDLVGTAAQALDIDGDGRLDRWNNAGITFFSHFPAGPTYPPQPALNLRIRNDTAIAPAETAGQAGYDADGEVDFDFEISGPAGRRYDVVGFYSLDGGQTWSAAEPAAESDIRNLAPGEYSYIWDVFASGVFGASDDVRFRLQVRPNFLPRSNQAPGLYQQPFAQTETLPFRVRGKQIQVLDANGENVTGAVVFHRPEAQTDQALPATLLRNRLGVPFTTSNQGFLNGRSLLNTGDQLVALWPLPEPEREDETDGDASPAGLIPFTNNYTLFLTSAAPTETGLDWPAQTAGGVTELAVSENNKLLIFHLNVSLEWDARSDPLFLQELAAQFQQASALLYDVTDGQVALGQINLFHEKAYWSSADIVVHADNGRRPSAAIGGVVEHPVDDTDADGNPIPGATYLPGQIHMGTVWDPYGERTADLGADWGRALAHELAHYLLFLPDNYLGIEDGRLRRIVCRDSFMTSTIDPGYSELLTETQWLEPCPSTLAATETERFDWETVVEFYPMLRVPDDNRRLAGPTNLPIAITRMTPWIVVDDEAAPRPVPPLAARTFTVQGSADERLRLTNAQVYLIKTQQTAADLRDDMLVPLGGTSGGGDRFPVRGAAVGDRLCIFGTIGTTSHAGCIQALSADDVAIEVAPVANWNPRITAVAEDEYTATITVAQDAVACGSLQAQIYPLHYGSIPNNAPTSQMAATEDGPCTVTLELQRPAYEIAVRVWQDIPGCTPAAHACTGVHETLTTLRLNPPAWNLRPATETEQANLPVPAYAPIFGPNDVPLGGPNDVPLGGPNDVPLGGPNDVPLGGPNDVPIGGPNDVPLGGPNDVPIGGPNDVPLGGSSTEAYAPIASADSQVVIYRRDGFFQPNGIERLQVLDSVPQLDASPWLQPIGQAYAVELAETSVERFISFTYLQRDVPAGYEYTLGVYFLPDCTVAPCPGWTALDTELFPENLAVAGLEAERSGLYALMATLETPSLRPGWNLLAYPMPDCRSRPEALASLGDTVTGLVLAQGFALDGGQPSYNLQAPETPVIEVDNLEPGNIYWIYIESETAVTPAFHPPRFTAGGEMETCAAPTESP